MDIQQFVKESLCQIIEGVKQAKEKHDNVNPWYEIHGAGSVPGNAIVDSGGQLLFMVDFDLAVMVTEESTQSGNIGLKIKIVAAGGGVGTGTSLTSVTRVKFAVPISYHRK